MYITQEIANKIKVQAKNRKIHMKELLPACDLNINAISEFSKGKQLSCISLAKIADYLDCSVDYLLGRDKAQQVANIHNVGGNGIAIGNVNGSATIKNTYGQAPTEEADELLRIFDLLDIKRRHRLLDLAFSLEEEIKEKI